VKKILFVLAMFVVFRIMANIPVPGIDVQNLKNFFNQFQMFGLLNVFTGGALDNLSIAMLGLGPYITAIIIFQLLTMIFPSLERLYKEEGEVGRQKFNQYCRIATVPLAAIQGYGMLTLLSRQNVITNLSPGLLFTSILTIVAGAIFLMWLGELITEKGIGNGISLLIFAGIVADFPNNLRQLLVTWDPAKVPSYLLFFGLSLVIVAGVIRMYGGVSTYLPLNVNPAGVIPIIFALSILLFPSMVANFLGGAKGIVGSLAQGMKSFFENPWVHGILYFVLVVLFTYFYTAVTFDPKSVARNLQKMGGFIPGIRPGESTAHFMNYILNRVLLIGALFLGTIAVMPSIVGGVTGVHVFRFMIGGTSLLIVVSVVLETINQINAQLEMRQYETI